MNRRQALGAFGSVGLATLLGACGSRGDGGAAVTTAEVGTTGGTTATVEPQTAPAARGDFDGAAACTLTPEQTEGPYYFDVDAIRSDIREDRAGVPLRLGIRVQSGEACSPLPNVVVDIWHCDAGGVYSGFESASRGGGGTRDEETYLRGAQVTNADGVAEFLTFYPGWYPGRTPLVLA